MYQTSTAPPGRCFPRIVSISLSQVRDNARSPSSAATGLANGEAIETPIAIATSESRGPCDVPSPTSFLHHLGRCVVPWFGTMARAQIPHDDELA